ncbi:MAG: SAM-dependent methyltransferase [Pseudomonadota bacterium]
MSIKVEEAVPWGRTFEEYVAMFHLTAIDLNKSILGCGDGPASFNATSHQRNLSVISADPIYAFTAQQISVRIDEVAPDIIAQLRRDEHELVWEYFASLDDLIGTRHHAMTTFLEDFADKSNSSRYVTASLPTLPFSDSQFDLALCSHFLFLYGKIYSQQFHLDSILEMCRVANEVRIFPLVELEQPRSRHLSSICETLEQLGHSVERVRVNYELIRGGNEMLKIKSGQ